MPWLLNFHIFKIFPFTETYLFLMFIFVPVCKYLKEYLLLLSNNRNVEGFASPLYLRTQHMV